MQCQEPHHTLCAIPQKTQAIPQQFASNPEHLRQGAFTPLQAQCDCADGLSCSRQQPRHVGLTSALSTSINRTFSARRTPNAILRSLPEQQRIDAGSSCIRCPILKALAEAGLQTLSGPFLDFYDPWGNRVEIVGYDSIQFSKAPNVLRGMGLSHLSKNSQAIKDLAEKGMAPV